MFSNIGKFISHLTSPWLSKEQVEILMVGPNKVGKSTILYSLKSISNSNNQNRNPASTIGYNIETFEYHQYKVTLWDVGSSMPALWKNFYDGKQAVIYVIDASLKDSEEIQKIKKGLHQLLGTDELRDTVLLVYANKQDLENCYTLPEIVEKLDLCSIPDFIPWHVEPVCAIKNKGLGNGLSWLLKELAWKSTQNKI